MSRKESVMRKPRIAITMNYCREIESLQKAGVSVEGQCANALAEDYSNAVIEAGGIPILVPVVKEEVTEEILKDVQGLIVSGGEDMDPLLAQQRPDKTVGPVCVERDLQELFSIRYCLENKIPFFGICRGLQLLNVALGGNLLLDLKTAGFLDHSLHTNQRYMPVHSVDLSEESILFDIFGKKQIWVNSYHHQGIGVFGQKLKPIAWSEDGVCEALFYEGDSFALAVQWHPEMMAVRFEEQKKLFSFFLKKCVGNE